MDISNQNLYAQLAMAKLPSLPQALLQILELAERDDASVAEMAQVVSQDVSLAAKIVSTANSAYYSRGRHIVSIEQCLSVMGAAQVRRIALNQSVAELFGRFQKSGGFDLREYWHQVLCVAVTSRELSKRLNYPNADEAYLAGLLHDVGQLALLMAVPDRYQALFNAAEDEQGLQQAEHQQFGLTHAEVGAWLAERWQLHTFFADALLYHHEPLARVRDAHALVQIVALADHLCSAEKAELAEEALSLWALTPDDTQALRKQAEAEALAIAESMGIEIAVRKAKPVISSLQDDSAHARLAEAVSVRMEATATLPDSLPATAPDTSRADLHLGLLRSAKMLFATRNACLFVAEANVLQGLNTREDDSRLGEIRIALPATTSAIARAMAGEIGLAGENIATDSLADAQVLRILGVERLLCLPLRHDEQALGVLVVGLEASEAQAFLQRKALISTFAREGGRRLAEALQQFDQVHDARAEAEAEFQLHARKVVHEANNPLGVVRNYIALLRQQLGEKHQAQGDIDLVESELRRVARILQDMKNADSAKNASALGSNAGSYTGTSDINTLINEVIRFCRMGRPELASVATHLNLESPLPPARVNADKVKQVLTNLIFNAAEAMPGGGEITISTSVLKTSLASPTGQPPSGQSHPSRNAIEITVSDTGPGIPAEVMERLYQPVSSRKGGSHQGLGLSIISKLVQDMGGLMQCKSAANGTHFKILLPANG